MGHSLCVISFSRLSWLHTESISMSSVDLAHWKVEWITYCKSAEICLKNQIFHLQSSVTSPSHVCRRMITRSHSTILLLSSCPSSARLLLSTGNCDPLNVESSLVGLAIYSRYWVDATTVLQSSLCQSPLQGFFVNQIIACFLSMYTWDFIRVARLFPACLESRWKVDLSRPWEFTILDSTISLRPCHSLENLSNEIADAGV